MPDPKPIRKRPPITARKARVLRSLSVYASAEVDMISDGTADQQQEAAEVREACGWLNDLCNWYEQKSRAKSARK